MVKCDSCGGTAVLISEDAFYKYYRCTSCGALVTKRKANAIYSWFGTPFVFKGLR